MRQFLFFVFQAVYTILANVIDDGFANKVSIDSVIAYGSYIPMIWAFQSVYNIGKYAYMRRRLRLYRPPHRHHIYAGGL